MTRYSCYKVCENLKIAMPKNVFGFCGWRGGFILAN